VGVDAGQPIEKRDELSELVLVVWTAHELADLPGVRLRGLAQLGAAGLGQDRIDDATIARALLARDQAVALETVEEPGHPTRGQQQTFARSTRRICESGARASCRSALVGVDVQAVIGAQLSAELTRHRHAGADQAYERVDRGRGLGSGLL
jgi:hypothetical protein